MLNHASLLGRMLLSERASVGAGRLASDAMLNVAMVAICLLHNTISARSGSNSMQHANAACG